MLKRSAFFVLGLIALALAAFFLQPMKKGQGLDATTRYEQVHNWLHLPNEVRMGNPTGLGIDTSDHLIVFCRAGRDWPLLGSMPETPIKQKTIFIINKNSGKLIDSWGDHLFIMPHGLTVDHANNIWTTDVGLHQVFKFSHDGKLLLTLGERKVPGNDSVHFNRPTDVAVAKDGSFYVSDGYGNSRIIRFSATGKYLYAWGQKGSKVGAFNIPHGICLDSNGHVYVADRENNRIQVFDAGGGFIKQIAGETFGAICSVAFDPNQKHLFTTDDVSFLKIKHRGSDVLILDTTGQVQTRFGRSSDDHKTTSWYHDIVVDKDGTIYVGDLLTNTIQRFRKKPGITSPEK